MKSTVTERRLVVVLFLLVMITFSLAQRDSKRLNHAYSFAPEKKSSMATAVKTRLTTAPEK